jgi:hypothetical protein
MVSPAEGPSLDTPRPECGCACRGRKKSPGPPRSRGVARMWLKAICPDSLSTSPRDPVSRSRLARASGDLHGHDLPAGLGPHQAQAVPGWLPREAASWTNFRGRAGRRPVRARHRPRTRFCLA